MRTGKKLPLDADTKEPHDCPAHKSNSNKNTQQTQLVQQLQLKPKGQQTQQRCYLQCSKGCSQEIYFDVNAKTQSGKSIPLDKETGQPHQCQQ